MILRRSCHAKDDPIERLQARLLRGQTMLPTKSDGTAKRRPWQPPALTVLAIGRETKSSNRNAAQASGSSQTEPQPPAAPATKLGFALEWAFPLSARWEK
jgi:hypothetical protein